MKIWNFIKKIFKSTCVYFTLISIVILLLGLLDGNDASKSWFTTSTFLFLPFGLCMAFAQELLCAKRFSGFARYVGHYVITIAAIIGMLAFNASFSTTNLIILIFFLTILYWIIFGIVILLRRRLKKLMEED